MTKPVQNPSVSPISRWLLWTGFLISGLLLVSCESAKAPAPPVSTVGSQQNSGTSTGSSNSSDSSLGNSTSSSSSSSSDDSDDEEDEGDSSDPSHAAIKKCNSSGKVYDRFADDGAGKCSTLKTASLTCTESGIKKALTGASLTKFKNAIDGDYSEWTIDQCGDCPPDTSNKMCKTTSGTKQTGTKIFFIKEDADNIKGKTLVVSDRPGQDEDEESSDE